MLWPAVSNLTVGLHFEPQGEAVVGGDASSATGIYSTRLGNTPAWADGMRDKVSVGAWTLTLDNTKEVKDPFTEGVIEDILFVIIYSSRVPAWPE